MIDYESEEAIRAAAISSVADYTELLVESKKAVAAVAKRLAMMRAESNLHVISAHAINPAIIEANECLLAAIHRMREAQAHLALACNAFDHVAKIAHEGVPHTHDHTGPTN